MKNVQIEFEKKVVFPDVCSCCLAQCKTEKVMKLSVIAPGGETREFDIPTCPVCRTHWTKTVRYAKIEKRLSNLFFILFLGFGINLAALHKSLGFFKALLVGIIIFGSLAGFLSLILRVLKPKPLKQPGHIDPGIEPVDLALKMEDKGKDFLKFTFNNRDYAVAFRKANNLIDTDTFIHEKSSDKGSKNIQKIESVMKKYRTSGKKYIELFFNPAIPEKKLKNAIQFYAKDAEKDQVLCLADNTIINNGKRGVLVTHQMVYVKNEHSTIEMKLKDSMPVSDIQSVRLDTGSNNISINGSEFIETTYLTKEERKVLTDFLFRMSSV